jgi:hypothetical protein
LRVVADRSTIAFFTALVDINYCTTGVYIILRGNPNIIILDTVCCNGLAGKLALAVTKITRDIRRVPPGRFCGPS